MKTLIISAFPACGKTYLFNNQNDLEFNTMYGKKRFSFLDSDSGRFSKHAGWEKEYVNHIEANIGQVDFIFVSQHEEVLRELQTRSVPFIVVAPESGEFYDKKEREKIHMLTKQQWFGRFVLRDNTHISDMNAWLKTLSDNYDKWISVEHLTKHNPVAFFALTAQQYLSDIIEDLYWKKETYSMAYVFNRNDSRTETPDYHKEKNDDYDSTEA